MPDDDYEGGQNSSPFDNNNNQAYLPTHSAQHACKQVHNRSEPSYGKNISLFTLGEEVFEELKNIALTEPILFFNRFVVVIFQRFPRMFCSCS